MTGSQLVGDLAGVAGQGGQAVSREPKLCAG